MVEQNEQDYDTTSDVRIAYGDQKAGKTGLCVGFIKDDYYDKLTGLVAPNNSGQTIKARTLSEADKQTLIQNGMEPDPFKYVRVFSDDCDVDNPNPERTKLIAIPKGYMVWSPVRIFANIHLFGMRYVYRTPTMLAEHFNDDLLTDAWFMVEDSAENNPQEVGTIEGKGFNKFMQTVAKRHLKVLVATQWPNMVTTYTKQFRLMNCVCSYDKDTHIVTAEVDKKGEPHKKIWFDLSKYWMNYNPDERTKMPAAAQQRMMDKLNPLGEGIE